MPVLWSARLPCCIHNSRRKRVDFISAIHTLAVIRPVVTNKLYGRLLSINIILRGSLNLYVRIIPMLFIDGPACVYYSSFNTHAFSGQPHAITLRCRTPTDRLIAWDYVVCRAELSHMTWLMSHTYGSLKMFSHILNDLFIVVCSRIFHSLDHFSLMFITTISSKACLKFCWDIVTRANLI